MTIDPGTRSSNPQTDPLPEDAGFLLDDPRPDAHLGEHVGEVVEQRGRAIRQGSILAAHRSDVRCRIRYGESGGFANNDVAVRALHDGPQLGLLRRRSVKLV